MQTHVSSLAQVLGNAVGQQIVVCGDTSTGKSTTINFILGDAAFFPGTTSDL